MTWTEKAQDHEQWCLLFLFTDSKDSCTETLQWLPANEILPSSEQNLQLSVCIYPCGKYKLKHVPFEEAIKHLSGINGEEFIAEAEALHLDLLPGKYEGSLVQRIF